MNTNENKTSNQYTIAIVGKSPLFPVVNEPKSFWPALIALKGLLPELAAGSWPFCDLLSEERLGKLKLYFMESGLLSGGKLPDSGFEIPLDILKIDEVIPVIALFSIKQALNDTASFSANKIDCSKVFTGFYSFADNPGIQHLNFDLLNQALKTTGISAKKADALHKAIEEIYAPLKSDFIGKQLTQQISDKYNFSENMINEEVSSLSGSLDSLRYAFKKLQSDETDMVIVGGVNSVNASLSFIENLFSDETADDDTLRFVEGMGFLTLRRLVDAEKDGDTIYAKISNVDNISVSFISPFVTAAESKEISREMPATLLEFMRSENGFYPSPFTNLGRLSQAKKEEFLDNNRYVKGASFSKIKNDISSILKGDIAENKWLSDKLNKMYEGNANTSILPSKVLLSEHLSQFVRLNASDIVFNEIDQNCSNLPYNDLSVNLQETEAEFTVQGSIGEMLNWKMLRDSWVKTTGSHRFFHDLLGILSGSFINKIIFENPEKLKSVLSKPVIYMANHQVGIESPLFMALSNAISGIPIQAVAKPDHVNTWLAFLMAFAEDSLGPDHPFKLAYFDKTKPLELLEFLKTRESRSASLLVHVEGTRDSRAGQPVEKLSSVFIDMAIANNTPIVPVRFVGGLPIGLDAEKLDFPYKGGRQDYFFGEPILPEELKTLFYGQRPKFIMEKINSLGPLNDEDFPGAPIQKFVDKQKFLIDTLGLPTMQAMLFAMLGMIDDPCKETATLIDAAKSGKIDPTSMPPALQKFMMHLSSKK